MRPCDSTSDIMPVENFRSLRGGRAQVTVLGRPGPHGLGERSVKRVVIVAGWPPRHRSGYRRSAREPRIACPARIAAISPEAKTPHDDPLITKSPGQADAPEHQPTPDSIPLKDEEEP